MPPFVERARAWALVESVLVMLTWASSFVLVKLGLNFMGPLTIAALRYFCGFALLLPLVLHRGGPLRAIPGSLWLRFLLLGLSAYTIANGAYFWSLKYIPAITGSLILSFIPLFALLGSILWLKEFPTRRQWWGMLVVLAGMAFFFSWGWQGAHPLGIALALLGTVSFALFTLLGRDLARARQVDVWTLTALPLGLGGGMLLPIALAVEGAPSGAWEGWLVVLALAVFNTAGAYVAYNHALQVLTALEMNVILNLSPLVTAALAGAFLAERLTILQGVGIVITIAGVFLVQWRPRRA